MGVWLEVRPAVAERVHPGRAGPAVTLRVRPVALAVTDEALEMGTIHQ